VARSVSGSTYGTYFCYWDRDPKVEELLDEVARMRKVRRKRGSQGLHIEQMSWGRVVEGCAKEGHEEFWNRFLAWGWSWALQLRFWCQERYDLLASDLFQVKKMRVGGRDGALARC
jgi:hypothetical protein